jgi:hypothetical protein
VTEQWTPPTGIAPRIGATICLIRWTKTLDGWTSETVTGHYRGTTDNHWILDRFGTELCLDRTEWSLCTS